MKLHQMENRSRKGFASFGAIWEKGTVQSADSFILKGENGNAVPVQSRVTAWWPDHSVKWSCHSADMALIGAEGEILPAKAAAGCMEAGTAIGAFADKNKEQAPDDIRICETEDYLCVDAGKAVFSVPKKGQHVLEHLYFSGAASPAGTCIKPEESVTSGVCMEQSGTGACPETSDFIPYARLVLKLEETLARDPGEQGASAKDLSGQNASEEDCVKKITTYYGETESVAVEECGPVKCVICVRGIHVSPASGRRVCPFVFRITVWRNSGKLDFQHTFIYDGDVSRDALKGLGVEFHTRMGLHKEFAKACAEQAPDPVETALYNRHIRILTDHGSFHETPALMTTWRPRANPAVYEAQLRGEALPENGEGSEVLQEALKVMPHWSDYRLVQDSAEHYGIEKKVVEDGCCYIQAVHGHRAPGALAFGSCESGWMLAKQDFWQKYPSGLELKGLACREQTATVWFWSPQAEAFDYRHYAVRGYNQAYYEGFDNFGATPYGIANTNQFSLAHWEGSDAVCACQNGMAAGAASASAGASEADAAGTKRARVFVGEADLREFALEVQKPAVLLGDPEYYHTLRAFGYWSLPSCDTPMERYLEEQLDKAFEFYKNEIEIRSWYGFYNYGDIMHTYDRVRHVWKYDMGGYAWQNTELVPTLWLWLYFMRTGREDVFTMAEAMSRHCSECDTYHLGPYKGLGSRHNVRHWGCPCKEARIGMAGHHRYYYYLTGDGRMQDIFEDAKDADFSTVNIDPMRTFYPKEGMVYPTHARSGPDWSSFCSNWMTRWERFDDQAYRDKLCVGIGDLKTMPLKLVSGSDFEYDPESGHLRYIGERAAGGTHLQICMGAAEVWLELSLLLEDPEWTRMLADYGRFYYLSREEQIKESKGLVNDREFSLPFMAAAMGAFGAKELGDASLARKTWRILMGALVTEEREEGFAAETVENAANCAEYREIPWISTNFTAQWCLNAIMVLEFIRDALPKDWDDMNILLREQAGQGFHKA